MWLGEVGVARLPPQQLHSYLYWYVQKLLEKKSEINKMNEKTGWGNNSPKLGIVLVSAISMKNMGCWARRGPVPVCSLRG